MKSFTIMRSLRTTDNSKEDDVLDRINKIE